jgi:hypothetical protein
MLIRTAPATAGATPGSGRSTPLSDMRYRSGSHPTSSSREQAAER